MTTQNYAGGEQPTGGDNVGGPRHYEGPTLGRILMWKCPACGAENTGDVATGCTSCGSGSAQPRHVGVPPSNAVPAERIGIGNWEGHDGKGDVVLPPNFQVNELADAAFETWIRRAAINADTAGVRLMYTAWHAAIDWVLHRQPQQAEPAEQTAPGSDYKLVEKVLLKQIIDTLEKVTDLPEDQQSPELQTLIAQLREIYEA